MTRKGEAPRDDRETILNAIGLTRKPRDMENQMTESPEDEDMKFQAPMTNDATPSERAEKIHDDILNRMAEVHYGDPALGHRTKYDERDVLASITKEITAAEAAQTRRIVACITELAMVTGNPDIWALKRKVESDDL